MGCEEGQRVKTWKDVSGKLVSLGRGSEGSFSLQRTHIVLPVLVQRFLLWRLLRHGCCCCARTCMRLDAPGLPNGGASAVLLLLLLLLLPSVTLGSIAASSITLTLLPLPLLLTTISCTVPSSIHPRRSTWRWRPVAAAASSVGPLPVGTGDSEALLFEDLARLFPLGLDCV